MCGGGLIKYKSSVFHFGGVFDWLGQETKACFVL